MTQTSPKDVVVIVDDDEGIRDLVNRVAQSIPQVETRLAASAREALPFVETDSPALVIADLNLPGEKGDWLLAQITKKGKAIPFVFLSASIDEGEEARLLELGALRVIRKPASPISLRNLIVKMLAREVRFDLVAETSSEVFVTGSFNDWNPRQHRMRDDRHKGFFHATLLLPRGRHEYKFIVDGDWCEDPKCPNSVNNLVGSMNSVIQV